MNEHDELQILCRFRSFLGIDRYRKFIFRLANDRKEKPAFVYWQRKAWGEFVERQPSFSQVPLTDPFLFLRCDVDGFALRRLDLVLSDFEFRNIREIRTIRDERIPFANSYRQCAACFIKWRDWLIENRAFTSIWRRKITLDDYFERFSELIQAGDKFGEQIIKHKNDIAARLQESDEIWEFDTGLEALSGCGGIGVFRNGELVEKIEMVKA